MLKLSTILSKIIQEARKKEFTSDRELILFEDSKLFQELSNPDFAYSYEEVDPDIWEFKDKYSNTLGVQFDPSSRYLETYYLARDQKGNLVKLFDYESNKDRLDPTSVQGGTDEHRSNTVCKILRDEIISKYLLNTPSSFIRIHPLNDYRHDIFWKCAEICKEKYPQLTISKIGKEIYILNKSTK